MPTVQRDSLRRASTASTPGTSTPHAPRPVILEQPRHRPGVQRFSPKPRPFVDGLAAGYVGVLGGHTPLVLGGDHSVAIGSVTGSAADGSIGAIWFDGHASLNTPSTSPSENIHRMPLGALLGLDEFADSNWANASGLHKRRCSRWASQCRRGRKVSDRRSRPDGFDDVGD